MWSMSEYSAIVSRTHTELFSYSRHGQVEENWPDSKHFLQFVNEFSRLLAFD